MNTSYAEDVRTVHPKDIRTAHSKDSDSGIVIQFRIPSAEDALNRIKHPGLYAGFYTILWTLSIPLVVEAAINLGSRWRHPSIGFYLFLIIAASFTLAEIYFRAATRGKRFWLSWASVPETLVSITLLITCTFSIVSGGQAKNITALIGAIVLLVRSVFQCLRVVLVTLGVTTLHQTNSGPVFYSPDVDIDDCDIRESFGPARPVQCVEDVLNNSVTRAVDGTFRIAELVLAIIAVVKVFDWEPAFAMVVNVLVVLEVVVCVKLYSRTPLVIGLPDIAACLLALATIVLAIVADAIDNWQLEQSVHIVIIVNAFVILARVIIRLLYYLYTILLSCKALFVRSNSIRLPEESDNSQNNLVDIAAESASSESV